MSLMVFWIECMLLRLEDLNLSNLETYIRYGLYPQPFLDRRLVRLEDLNLSHCGIQTVAAEVSKLARLRTFNISHNSVHSLPLTALEGMTNLVDLEVLIISALLLLARSPLPLSLSLSPSLPLSLSLSLSPSLYVI
jgi:hypothetical protein